MTTVCKQPPSPTTEERREFFMEGQQVLTTLSVGADIERRMMFLVGVVDDDMLYRFITAFKVLDQTDGPIAIFMSSVGGSMYAGAAIYDTIRTAHNPVVIQGTGPIMSMATVILQAGTVRFLTPETRFMIHNASMSTEGHLQSVSSSVRDVEFMNERYATILSERSKHSLPVIKEWLSKETYMTAQEAIDRGFADAVTSTRFLPASYEEGVAELNKFLPKGYVVQLDKDEKQLNLKTEPEAQPVTKKPSKKKVKKKGK
jgi:ATP-dependent Clp protease protease subunit